MVHRINQQKLLIFAPHLNQVITYVKNEYFKLCLPSTDICIGLEDLIKAHKDEISNLIKLFVLRIADGFDTQKGFFGLGTHAEDKPESVFNISSATQDVNTNWKKL